uniref:Uncharacterized protein n=1 Tax=Globodera rostochiensis TaxID=31243 RepID=A0A914HB28_GLORO
MSTNANKLLFHWSSLLMQGGLVFSPIIVNSWRNKLNHDFHLRKMISADLPNMPDENLLSLIEAELFEKSEGRMYPFEKADFGIKVQDDMESATYGFFNCYNSALFRFSTRLALADVETIRRHYPNFLRLFKENFASKWVKDLKSVWDNIRSAKGVRDLLTIFREKDLHHLHVDTSLLSDEDLQKVLLSPNAKKFVITREILLADSFFHAMPALYSFMSFGIGWILLSFLKLKMNERLAVAISFLFAVCFFIFLDRIDRINEVVKFDKECLELDDVHLSGAKEYLQSSIELGKLLNRLTNGKARFDANGNYERHMITYTDRLKILKLCIYSSSV